MGQAKSQALKHATKNRPGRWPAALCWSSKPPHQQAPSRCARAAIVSSSASSLTSLMCSNSASAVMLVRPYSATPHARTAGAFLACARCWALGRALRRGMPSLGTRPPHARKRERPGQAAAVGQTPAAPASQGWASCLRNHLFAGGCPPTTPYSSSPGTGRWATAAADTETNVAAALGLAAEEETNAAALPIETGAATAAAIDAAALVAAETA